MSAPAGLFNIVANQGSTLSRTILYRDPARKPIQLNGYTARMQVRPSITSDTVILELTTENGRISLGATTGIITLSATSGVMAAIPEDRYVYDLELISPSGYVYKLLYGNFVVKSEVTA